MIIPSDMKLYDDIKQYIIIFNTIWTAPSVGNVGLFIKLLRGLDPLKGLQGVSQEP